MAEMHHFTDGNFQAEVLEAGEPVLVDFTAAWCGPCRMLAPIIQKLNDEWDGAVKVGHLDIDENVNTAMAYEVLSIPTVILFKGGRPVERVMGFNARERLLKRLQPHLA